MKVLRAIAASAAGIFGYLFGGNNGIFIALVTMMIVDFITGVIGGAVTHKLNSKTCWVGITKKILTLFVVAVAHVIDFNVIGGGATLMTATELFFIANDGISIVENAAKCGVPIPSKLKTVLEQLKDKGDNDNDEGN